MIRRCGRLGTASLVALFALAAPPPLHGQELGLAAHMGTMGVGADLAVAAAPRLGVRASVNYFPFDITIDEDSVEYTLEAPSPQLLLVLDYYLTGQFRLTGGAMISTPDFELTAKLAEPIEIGDETYTPAEVGTLTGSLVNRSVALYLGIGFGDPTASRIGFFLDAGVAFHGTPELTVAADGPIASAPGFQADLDAEVEERQDDVDGFIVYPVLSLGLSFRIR